MPRSSVRINRQEPHDSGDNYLDARRVRLGKLLEFKSWYGFQKLSEYDMIVSYSLISLFDSVVCGEFILSKRLTKSGYFHLLSGTAVGLCTPTSRIRVISIAKKSGVFGANKFPK